MKYTATVFVEVDVLRAGGKGEYSDIALRSFVTSALNKSMQTTNENMPFGIRLGVAHGTTLVPYKEGVNVDSVSGLSNENASETAKGNQAGS